MTNRENYLQTVNFGNPQWIPINIAVNLSSLIEHKHEMEEVMVKYPEFFYNFQAGSIDYSKYGDGRCDIVEDDAWGYKWHYSLHGIEGCVTHHPLMNWDDFENYKAPDSNLVYDRGGARDWEKTFSNIKKAKSEGLLTSGDLVHGFLFLRLQYLRGFENLMIDMADEEPLLNELINAIDVHNLNIVNKYCSAKVDIMEIPEDLGAEKSMIINKAMFNQYIRPSYEKLVKPCHDNGILVAIHSDGYIIDIMDDLIDIGMDIINPQDLCNGIENLERTVKGKACIRLDLDRVKITPCGTRAEIFELIEEEVKRLGSKNGGLEFIFGVYPPTTPQNLSYVCEAFKKYQRYYW